MILHSTITSSQQVVIESPSTVPEKTDEKNKQDGDDDPGNAV